MRGKKSYVDILQTTRLHFFLKISVLLKADMPKGAEEFPVCQPKSTPQEL